LLKGNIPLSKHRFLLLTMVLWFSVLALTYNHNGYSPGARIAQAQVTEYYPYPYPFPVYIVVTTTEIRTQFQMAYVTLTAVSVQSVTSTVTTISYAQYGQETYSLLLAALVAAVCVATFFGIRLWRKPIVAESAAKKFCVGCGAQLLPGKRYCGQCGKAVAG